MKSRRSASVALLLAATTPLASSAAPLVSIGDSTDIFATLTGSARWMSNVFRSNSGEVDDLLFVISPGLQATFGQSLSNLSFSAGTSYDFLSYVDQSDLDTGLWHFYANGAYSGNRLELLGRIYYDQNQSPAGTGNQVNPFGNLTEFDKYGATLDGEYQLSPKFSFGGGIFYDETKFTKLEQFYSDQSSWGVPVNLYYELTPKLDASVGYRYRNTDVDPRVNTVAPAPGNNADNHFLNVGLRGQMAPKLTGTIKVGYNYRESDRTGDDSGLGADGDLVWVITPKFTSRIGFGRDFAVAGGGQDTIRTDGDIVLTYQLSDFIFASGDASWTNLDYNAGREDNLYRLGIRANYVPNQHWRFSTGYSYTDNDSNLSAASYNNHMLDLTASLRY